MYHHNISVFILCVLMTSVLAATIDQKITVDDLTCAKKHDIDVNTFDHGQNDFEKFMKIQKNKCYVGCLFKQHGLLKPDLTLNVEQAIKNLPEGIPNKDDILKTLTACSKETDENECDAAYKISKCLKDKAKENNVEA